MSEVSIIGLDIAKHVFQAHGVDASGHVLLRKKVSRAKLLSFFAAQPRCQVVLEACGGAHYWARELLKLGHDVRLIAPAYVKPLCREEPRAGVSLCFGWPRRIPAQVRAIPSCW